MIDIEHAQFDLLENAIEIRSSFANNGHEANGNTQNQAPVALELHRPPLDDIHAKVPRHIVSVLWKCANSDDPDEAISIDAMEVAARELESRGAYDLRNFGHLRAGDLPAVQEALQRLKDRMRQLTINFTIEEPSTTPACDGATPLTAHRHELCAE